MEYEVRETNSYTRNVSVSVPWNELEDEFGKVVATFGRRVSLPGFRKGKAPRRILFQKFGQEIEADFVQESVQKHYLEVLREENLSPVSQAKIDDVDFKRGESLEFKASFEVEPDVQLPNYRKKIKIKKSVYIPDDEDVDIYIEELRSQSAELSTVETGSKESHLLLVDMQEMDSTGLPIVGRKVEDRYIRVGEGVFGGHNLSRLTGLVAGDEPVVEVKGKGDGGNSETRYRLKVKNVQEEILPELDEEFIKKVDKSAANEEEFRKNILEKIRSRLERDSEREVRQSIIDHFVLKVNLDVPGSMVEDYVENALEDVRTREGEAVQDEEAFRKEVKPSAIKNLKWYLIRKAIIEAEGITVDDEEVESRVRQILQNSDDRKGQIRRFYRKPSNREHLREDLLDSKLFDHLGSFVKADEVKIHTRDLRRQQHRTANIDE